MQALLLRVSTAHRHRNQVSKSCIDVMVFLSSNAKRMEHKVNELQTKLKQEHREPGQSGVTPGNAVQHLITDYSKRREPRLLSEINWEYGSNTSTALLLLT